MATAIEKFEKAMKKISPFYTKHIEVTARNGKVVKIVTLEGFVFVSDDEEKGKNSVALNPE